MRWPVCVRCRRKKFTFAISSPDEFLLYTVHLTAKFHHPTINRSEVIVRTNKLTNRRCGWKHPPRFATLRRWVIISTIQYLAKHFWSSAQNKTNHPQLHIGEDSQAYVDGYSLFFPCNTITLGGTSKPIAFLGSGNDSDDYLLQPHFVRKNFFLLFFHVSYNRILE